MSERTKGYLITALGVLIITPDGLLTRLIVTDSWTLVFWRGVLSSIGMILLLLGIYRGQTWQTFRDIGRGGLLMAFFFGVGSIFFVFAITNTTVANTLILVSTSPIFAALIGWRVLNEPISGRTWAAIVAVLAGITIIGLGEGFSGGSMLGNLSALGAAIVMSITFSIARRYSDRNMVPATAIAGFMSALLVLPLAQPWSIPSDDVFALIVMGLIMLPVAFALMFIGPQYISAAEVTLMTLLETILGPLWVWLALGEEPGRYTLIGGTIVIIALAINAILPMFQRSGKGARLQSGKEAA